MGTDGRRDRLVHRREVLGFSQEDLAGALGVERSTVARWERGVTSPRPWQRPGLAQQLHVSFAELDELLVQQAGMPAASAPDIEPSADDHLGYALQHPARVDLVAVAQLRERVRHITEAYDRMPSVSLLAAAAQCQAQVASLREHAPDGRSSIRRELYAVEAEASTLMGQLVWDASQRRDHATTLVHFDHAVAAAQAVQDVVAEAHAILRKSYLALYGERKPEVGMALAAQAAQVSNGASHTLTGLALLHVAEAYGMLGDRQGCEQMLGDAQSHFARRNSLDAAADFFSPAQFSRLAGSCYLSLALPAKAEAYLEESAQAMQDGQKVGALVLGNLTLAYLQQRRLDEGTTTLHEAIDVVERTRGGGGLNVIFAAGRALRPWRHEPQVQAVHDRLLALMA